MNDPLRSINTRSTPQSLPIPGRTDMVRNNAGGYGFEVGKWEQALRFLILGTTSGTYYVTETALTQENSQLIIDLAKTDGEALVCLIEDISLNGRAPRQNPTLFALAACCASPDPATRRAATLAINKVCRTGTHLFIFAGYVEQFRGWGRALRSAVADWYLSKPLDSVAYQAVKYRQREGWSHRDLLRLSHPITANVTRASLFHWIANRDSADCAALPSVVEGFELAQATNSVIEWAHLVEKYKLPWEALPDAAMNEPLVWEAMLPHLGLGALVRQLGRLSTIGFISPMSSGAKLVADRLRNTEDISKSRIHPVAVLLAAATYGRGCGLKGNLTWNVVPQVLDAIDDTFIGAFGNVEPANKRTLVGIDVSGSMNTALFNSPLRAFQAAAALAMVVARTEPEYYTCAFSGDFQNLSITPKMGLADIIRATRGLSFSVTDVAVPIRWALDNRVAVDTFQVITDNESWAGPISVTQALQAYRQKMGISARLVSVATAATRYSVADPTDAGQMDCVGFDAATPTIVNAFSRGEL